MADIYKVNTPIRKPLFEGVQGENEARSIVFDITPWVEELGDGVVTATAKRSQDSQPYPVTVTKDGNVVTWKPTSTDTAFAGVGSFQLEYTVDSVLAKTCIWSTMVAPSLDPAGDPPDPYDNWLAEMRSIEAAAIQAADDAEDSAESVRGITDEVDLIESFVYEDVPVELPALKAGKFKIIADSDNQIISGTHNVAQLLGLKQGTYSKYGITVTVNGTEMTVSGTATAGFTFDLMTGEESSSSTLAAKTLTLPEHQYTLITAPIRQSGTYYPAIFIRKKDNTGTVALSQANAAQFTMDKTVCGGIGITFTNTRSYDFKWNIGVFPYATNNSEVYKLEGSSVEIITNEGVFSLDGYTWSVGTPSISLLKAKYAKPMLKYSTRQIPYTGADQVVDIYVPSKGGYVNYIFGHTITDISQSSGGGNVWRLIQIDAVDDSLAFKFHITTLGETEMAIMISGRSDFIGGWTHGDEWMDSSTLRFVVDGQTVDITGYTELTEFNTLQCSLVSDMYDPDDHSTNVGKHGREWKFDASGLELNQSVDFLTNLTLASSFMPMLCAVRGNDTVSTLQVTDTYIDDRNFIPYDIATAGFTNYPNQPKEVGFIHLLGNDSGLEATVELKEQPKGLKGSGAYVYNGVNTYNKIYCCICGYANSAANLQEVSAGDKWIVKSKFNIVVG